MNNSSDNKGKKILGYLFPGLITLLVMLIVLVAKGMALWKQQNRPF